MTIRMIQERLDAYQSQSIQEQEFALKEITQELALHSLYNAGFFKKAAFLGGTCLRILHGVNRFSEDLDFALIEPDSTFELKPYLASIHDEMRAFGYDVRIENRSKESTPIKSAFLKEDSIGKFLTMKYPKIDGPAKTIKIKFEIDINPPAGPTLEVKFHPFPNYFSIVAHDIPSLFAGKSHALLSRKYVKGRDWFDFLWYTARKSNLNYKFLSNALDQMGPWAGRHLQIDESWYRKALAAKIRSIDWKETKADVARFLRPNDSKTLELWSTDFFLSNLERVAS